MPFICAVEPGCPMCLLWLPSLDCGAFDWLLDDHAYIVMLDIPRTIVHSALITLRVCVSRQTGDATCAGSTSTSHS